MKQSEEIFLPVSTGWCQAIFSSNKPVDYWEGWKSRETWGFNFKRSRDDLSTLLATGGLAVTRDEQANKIQLSLDSG